MSSQFTSQWLSSAQWELACFVRQDSQKDSQKGSTHGWAMRLRRPRSEGSSVVARYAVLLNVLNPCCLKSFELLEPAKSNLGTGLYSLGFNVICTGDRPDAEIKA